MEHSVIDHFAFNDCKLNLAPVVILELECKMIFCGDIQKMRSVANTSDFTKYLLWLLFLFRLTGFFPIGMTSERTTLWRTSYRIVLGVAVTACILGSYALYLEDSFVMLPKANGKLRIFSFGIAGTIFQYMVFVIGIFLKSESIFHVVDSWMNFEYSFCNDNLCNRINYRRIFYFCVSGIVFYIFIGVSFVISNMEQFFHLFKPSNSGSFLRECFIGFSVNIGSAFLLSILFASIFILHSFKNLVVLYNSNLSSISAKPGLSVSILSKERFRFCEIGKLLQAINSTFGLSFGIQMPVLLISIFSSAYVIIRAPEQGASYQLVMSLLLNVLLIAYVSEIGNRIKGQVTAMHLVFTSSACYFLLHY